MKREKNTRKHSQSTRKWLFLKCALMRFHTIHHIYKFAVRKKVFEKIFFLEKSPVQPLFLFFVLTPLSTIFGMSLLFGHWQRRERERFFLNKMLSLNCGEAKMRLHFHLAFRFHWTSHQSTWLSSNSKQRWPCKHITLGLTGLLTTWTVTQEMGTSKLSAIY